MAAANSEDSPTLLSGTSSNSGIFERNPSRSPSLSSIKDFQWTTLLVSKPGKRKYKFSKGMSKTADSLLCFLFYTYTSKTVLI